MRYKFLDHMADVEFIAYGKTREELFTNALRALFETSADTIAVSRAEISKTRITVKEEADSLEELLWYTLQQALSMTEVRRVFAYEVVELKITEEGGKFRSNVRIYSKEKRDRYSKMSVKGISKYGLKITEGATMEARVVVDV